MYCNKCGKYIDYDATVCNECKAQEEAERKQREQKFEDRLKDELRFRPAGSYSRMYGFIPALVAAILGHVAFSLSMASFGAFVRADSIRIWHVLLIYSFLTFPGFACGVFGLRFGINGLKLVQRSKENGVTPIAPMVLDIVGIVSSGVGMFMVFIDLTYCVIKGFGII